MADVQYSTNVYRFGKFGKLHSVQCNSLLEHHECRGVNTMTCNAPLKNSTSMLGFEKLDLPTYRCHQQVQKSQLFFPWLSSVPAQMPDEKHPVGAFCPSRPDRL